MQCIHVVVSVLNRPIFISKTGIRLQNWSQNLTKHLHLQAKFYICNTISHIIHINFEHKSFQKE